MKLAAEAWREEIQACIDSLEERNQKPALSGGTSGKRDSSLPLAPGKERRDIYLPPMTNVHNYGRSTMAESWNIIVNEETDYEFSVSHGASPFAKCSSMREEHDGGEPEHYRRRGDPRRVSQHLRLASLTFHYYISLYVCVEGLRLTTGGGMRWGT
ncbi:uncharacterized protein LOC144716977 [Wolffia australiana]